MSDSDRSTKLPLRPMIPRVPKQRRKAAKQPNKSDKDIIDNWYRKLSSRFVDLISDYAGKETFLLEGDSLLLECFSDPRIDFDDGFQILHAVYVVEYFLENLQRRGCQFHIIFFADHENLCLPYSKAPAHKYLLTRSIIIKHLTSMPLTTERNVEVHLFDTLKDPEFRKYVNESGAYFVACCDGAQIRNARKQCGKSNRQYLRGMIHHFMSNFGLDVALVNGLEWRDSKIMTFVLEKKRMQGTKDKHIETIFKDCHQDLIKDNSRSHNVVPTPYEVQRIVDDLGQCEGVSDCITPRLIITMIFLKQFQTPSHATYCSALLLHVLLLNEMPLSARRQPMIQFDSFVETSIGIFIQEYSTYCRSLIERHDWSFTPSDLIDLFDGRLFRNVLFAVFDDHELVKGLSEDLRHSYMSLQRYLLKQTPTGSLTLYAPSVAMSTDESADAASPEESDSERGEDEVPNGDVSTEELLKEELLKREVALQTEVSSVLPFSHPLFDQHLASISITVKDRELSNVSSGKIFRELTHWHNSRNLLGRKRGRVMDPVEKARANKKNQRFMAEMTAYAASLTNASGKILTPETIITGSAKETRTGQSTANHEAAKKPAKQAKGKKSGKAVVQAQIAQGQAIQEKKDSAAALMSWKRWIADTLEAIPDLRSRYLRAIAYYDDKTGQKGLDAIIPELDLYKLSTLVQIWASYCKASKKNDGYQVAALMLVVMEKLARCDVECPAETSLILKKMATRIGFVLPPVNLQEGPPLTFPFAFQKSTSLELDMEPRDFSLLHAGPYFDRDMDSQDDHRVQFRPDGWQVKVLDLLDKKSSLLVVAPTSSGKTFISFYAMEKVLRANDDDVIVYVAPTKALVNQIAAEVQARFQKTYKYPGKSLYAIHTRDYRVNNPTQCQVLVTVPHILQIMLLSPSNAKTWAPRIKTIIFDEVHSIGQAEDGVVWEQLLLMAPCQVIALSATVGNPDAFTDWIQTSQNGINIDMQMVQHSTRFSDLRKFVYFPSRNSFEPLRPKPLLAPLGLENAPGFEYLHPVVSLTNEKRGIPDDLALESKDCLLLWQAMKKHETDQFKLPNEASPSKAVPEHTIGKTDIVKWGNALLNILRGWMKVHSSPFKSVVAELGKDFESAFDAEQKTRPEPGEQLSLADQAMAEFNEIADTALPMIAKLHAADALPAILFNYDRAGCEHVASTILSQLVSAEKQWRASNSAWKTKVSDFEAWKKAKDSKQQQKKLESAAKTKQKSKDDDEKQSKQDRSRDQSDSSDLRFVGFEPSAPSAEFSFANEKVVDFDDLRLMIKRLRWREIPETLIDAFQRGIGVHHAGMNRKYRQAVEMYFRKGYLRVVIATGTLSLGINMPCKTVVFCGDSVFLTALNFRQAAGRAGRRGFDLLGNVVFHGVSIHKACRLLSSRLPDLNGHFPLTTTLVLRSLILLHDSANSSYGQQAVNSLLSQPRLYLGGESFRHQVLHHLRFSIEYLRSQRLIGAKGEPLDFCSLIAHLYFTENAAFSFHALLNDGYLHRLASRLISNEKDTLRELMTVMANLFGRQPCKLAEEEQVRTGSKVFLPPLPEEAAMILKRHNISTLCTYQTYVRTYAQQHCKDEDRVLPFTGQAVGAPKLSEELNISFLQSRPATKSRSSFFALSGHSDVFTSISDLCTSVRSGIFLEEAVVPYLSTGDELKHPLNAYLLDFYSHGDKHALEVSNGIKRGEVWFLLNDFSLVLSTIIASLENFLKPGNAELDLTAVGGLADETEINRDVLEEETFAPPAASDAASEASTLVAQPKKVDVKGKKKKKVVDDWEAESSEGEEANGEDDADGVDDLQNGNGVEDGAEAGGLVRVLMMFKMLKAEFDGKFRKIFA